MRFLKWQITTANICWLFWLSWCTGIQSVNFYQISAHNVKKSYNSNTIFMVQFLVLSANSYVKKLWFKHENWRISGAPFISGSWITGDISHGMTGRGWDMTTMLHTQIPPFKARKLKHIYMYLIYLSCWIGKPWMYCS